MTPKQIRDFKLLNECVKILVGQQNETIEKVQDLEDQLGIERRKVEQLVGVLKRIPRIDPESWHDLSEYKTPKVEFLDQNFDKLKAWSDAVCGALSVLGLQPAADALREAQLAEVGRAPV